MGANKLARYEAGFRTRSLSKPFRVLSAGQQTCIAHRPSRLLMHNDQLAVEVAGAPL